MVTACITVLLVEDNPMDAMFVMEALAAANGRFAVEHVTNLAAAVSCLDEGGVDVVVLDLNLPDSAGPQTYVTLLRHAGECPVVVLTGEQDERTGIAAVEQGVQDYLLKGSISGAGLVKAMRYAMARREGHRDQETQVVAFRIEGVQPHWDASTREFTLGGVLVKIYRQEARNQTTILAAFEEEGWPERIDDPLPQHGEVDPKERLRQTLKALNSCQRHTVMHFFGDGTGRGIQWKFLLDQHGGRRSADDCTT